MNENNWTASTSTSWIYFDSAHTSKTVTGTGGETITIYVEEATEPTTDVEGSITMTANGNSFKKVIKRCSPTVSKTDNTLDFCVYYSSVSGGMVGPCEGGTSQADTDGVSVKNITLTKTETYSNGGTKTTTSSLSESDVNVWYYLPDGTRYSILPSNKGQNRTVDVRVELKSNTSIFSPTASQKSDNPTCYTFTQSGIKTSDGSYDESKLHSVGYESQSTVYRGFDIADSCKAKSGGCAAGSFSYSVIGEKVTAYGAKTGLTDCNEKVYISTGEESTPTSITTSDVSFSVAETQYARFEGNTLYYIENDTRTTNRELNITARLDGNGETKTTVFTVVAGNDCGDPLYIVFKCNKDNIDFGGGTATFKYYLTNTEGASEGLAIKDQTINSCLQFLAPQGVTTGNSSYTEGVYSVDVTFTQNTYMGGEEGRTWSFSATCSDATNSPEEINLYQANKYEQIIPNCDYFIFKYIWTDADGTDMDSLTHLSNCPTLSGKTVGFGGTSANQVAGTGGKLYLKWGGDNRCNGSEYTIVCLKSIVEDFKDQKVSFENDVMWVDIYAVWYSSRSAGNMNIVYDQYTGLTSGGFSEEIKEVEHINECISSKPKYYSFEPVEGKCESVAEGVSTSTINVSANGSKNYLMAKTVDCIDGAYTHALRLIYNFAAKTTSIQYFKDNGVNTRTDKITTVINGVDYTNAVFTASTGEAVDVTYNNVYIKHTVNGVMHNVYLFDTTDDYVYMSEINGSYIRYYHSDLGNEKNLSYTKKIKFVKNADKTVNITFSMDATTEELPEHHFYITPHCVIDYYLPCGDFTYTFSDIDVYQKNT